MSIGEELLMVLGMLAVTFGVRFPVLKLAGARDLPNWLRRALRYVPVAVLTAIVVPMMLMPEGALWISVANAHIVAGVVAAVIAAVTRHLMLTIVVGMSLFLLLRFL